MATFNAGNYDVRRAMVTIQTVLKIKGRFKDKGALIRFVNHNGRGMRILTSTVCDTALENLVKLNRIEIHSNGSITLKN